MPPPTSRVEIERKLLVATLVERYVDLALRAIVMLALVAATVVCVIKGSPWPTPSITSAASTFLLASGTRRVRL
jgi:hypothetical protein